MQEHTVTLYFDKNYEEIEFCLQSMDRHPKTFNFVTRVEDDERGKFTMDHISETLIKLKQATSSLNDISESL